MLPHIKSLVSEPVRVTTAPDVDLHALSHYSAQLVLMEALLQRLAAFDPEAPPQMLQVREAYTDTIHKIYATYRW